MGRALTKARNPVVLYVSGGNTQVIAYSLRRYVAHWTLTRPSLDAHWTLTGRSLDAHRTLIRLLTRFPLDA